MRHSKRTTLFRTCKLLNKVLENRNFLNIAGIGLGLCPLTQRAHFLSHATPYQSSKRRSRNKNSYSEKTAHSCWNISASWNANYAFPGHTFLLNHPEHVAISEQVNPCSEENFNLSKSKVLVRFNKIRRPLQIDVNRRQCQFYLPIQTTSNYILKRVLWKNWDESGDICF